MAEASRVANTIAYLRRCQQARAAGYPIAFTTDPAWLVHMAINRRAGWPDDPSLLRGSAMPVNGRYPKSASGDEWRWLRLFAQDINRPRLRIYRRQCPKRYRVRLAYRLTEDFAE